MLFYLVFLPALVAGLTGGHPRQANAHHLPLVRRTSHHRGEYVDPGDLARAATSLRIKYHSKSRYGSGLGRRASMAGISTLNSAGDNAYLVRLEVGNPPQALGVQLDTGSSDLWLATTTCTDCSSGLTFNVSQSSSVSEISSEPPLLVYGTGNVSGTLLQDAVSLGPYTVPKQTFLGATQVTNGFVNGSFAGILGLAFEQLAQTKVAPIWQALIDAGELDAPMMSFYLTRFKGPDVNATSLDPGGTFTLGGTNSSLYKGDIDFQPLTNVTNITSGFWGQTITGITVNGHKVDIESGVDDLAVIDTGTTLIGGPTDGVQAFWAQVNGSQEIESGQLTGMGFYQFPCATNINSAFSFGGKAWSVSAEDMNQGALPGGPEGLCVGAVFDFLQNTDFTGRTPWVMGDVFLKNVYTVLRAGDNPAVGFAELADDLNGSSSSAGVRTARGPATGHIAIAALSASIAIAALVLQ